MGSERGKYVMSVELAMRREMAHRERLELLKLIQRIESKQVTAPTSQTSFQASRPTSEIGSTWIPKTGPKLSDPLTYSSQKSGLSSLSSPQHTSMMNKVTLPPKSPSSTPRPNFSSQAGPNEVPRTKNMLNPNPIPPQGPSSLPRPNYSSQSGPRSALTPILSFPARPRLKSVVAIPPPPLPWLDKSHGGPNIGPRPSSLPTRSLDLRSEPTINSSHKRKEAPIPTHQLQANHNHNGNNKRKFYCEVCEVQCTSFSNLHMHLMGQKHKAKVKKGKGVEIMEIDTRKRCDVCEIWCMNEYSFKQHINGKNHLHKFHTANHIS